MRARLLFLVAPLLAAAGLVALQPISLRSDSRPGGFRADVLVVGGSPAGVAAALAAARQGLIVVLVERRPFLGTVLTGAMLNMWDLSRKSSGEHLIKGLFLELYRKTGGVTFDPRELRMILRETVQAEPGVTLLLNTEVVEPRVERGQVIGAWVRTWNGQTMPIRAPITIDATDDGDFAAAAGVPFTFGREASAIDRRTMPATLMFRVGGVDWGQIVRYAYAHRRERQPSGAYRGYAWGFRALMRNYRPEDPRLSAHDLNIGRLPDESVLMNSLQIHDVVGTDRAARIDAYKRARREIPNLVAYLRGHVPGFASAHLIETAPELYIRETRHLRGLYTLTVKDIATRTRFWDRIAAASYPVDLHQYKKGEQYPFKPERREYTIPLRALIAANLDGLLFASRAFSATYQAAGSARVVPTTMAMGEGAGVAAAAAVEHRVTPHELVRRPELIQEVQRRLVRAGAVIDY